MIGLDLNQLDFVHPTLRQIVLETQERFGFIFVVTSMYRINDPGVHGVLPLRGIDIRCRNYSLAKVIEGEVNYLWDYDPDRPTRKVCVAHGEQSNFHLHFQVHPNTKRVETSV
jgi:hypothetical protein